MTFSGKRASFLCMTVNWPRKVPGGGDLPDPQVREHRVEAIHQLERWDGYQAVGTRVQLGFFQLAISTTAAVVYALLDIADAIREHP